MEEGTIEDRGEGAEKSIIAVISARFGSVSARMSERIHSLRERNSALPDKMGWAVLADALRHETVTHAFGAYSTFCNQASGGRNAILTAGNRSGVHCNATTLRK